MIDRSFTVLQYAIKLIILVQFSNIYQLFYTPVVMSQVYNIINYLFDDKQFISRMTAIKINGKSFTRVFIIP